MNKHENIDFQRFYELSIDMLCIANTNGFFVSVNNAFSDVLGYSKEELLSRPLFDFVHPDDLYATNTELANIQHGVINLNFTNRYKHKNGHFLTLSWNSHIDPENGLIYALARDITEELNQTNRLRQIETALSKETIYATTDHKGIITFVNDKFCEVSGYRREALIGQTHRVINSGYHSKDFFKQLWKKISSGEIWSGVIKNKKKSGEYYYVQTFIIPIMDHQGTISSYLSVRQDITKSIVSEVELQKTLDILNETNAIAKVGGWELDIKTNNLTWTDETFRLLEVEKKQGQCPVLEEGLALFTPEYQPVIEKAVNDAINFGKPYSLELQAQTAKGNILWVYTNGKPNYENGEIVSLSGTIQDINDKKIADIKFDLERQKSIQNAKLASLGELAASMAHEINNPLGVISGYAELLTLSEDLTENVHQKMEIILKSCERIAYIVRNLKRFSQPEKQKTYKNVSLSKIINEAISLVKPKLKNERILLNYHEHPQITIFCSEIEIEQVMLNLINNAVDAVKLLDERWIDISVDQHAHYVEIFITDSGAGIPETIQKSIFEPFFSTKPNNQGTGLGLSIIKDILEKLDGSIYLKTDNKHTCFVVKLPRTPSA